LYRFFFALQAHKRPNRHRESKKGDKKIQKKSLDFYLCEPEHVHRPQEARLDRLDRVVLVVDGAGGASQVVDLVDFEQDLLDDIVPDELKVGLADQVGDVFFGAREKVVEADDVVASLDEVGAQMRADEARASRDDDAVGLDAGLGLDEGFLLECE